MDRLIDTIRATPIIDHHAHNLLLPAEIDVHSFLSITTEAGGSALDFTSSTLAHLRAVKQLAEILQCPPTWEAVQKAIQKKRGEPEDAWSRRCFEGIESVLIDDGLDANTVHPYDWHNRLTMSKCKRIVRIEKVAESVIADSLQGLGSYAISNLNRGKFLSKIRDQFLERIRLAIDDPEVVGFKSIICYRSGLKIPTFKHVLHPFTGLEMLLASAQETTFRRLEDQELGPYFVHLTAQEISQTKNANGKKPFQFHTGLGDNDLNLPLSCPSHLQPFIHAYPSVPIVLLHASYPFTTEAGYLASAYQNVYMDIGEVFPMVSAEGQEKVIREALELCPTEKLCWSTDGHWFPETYLLAAIQVREALEMVLCDYVRSGSLNVAQAIKVVQDILFNTSNTLYKLELSLKPLALPDSSVKTVKSVLEPSPASETFPLFTSFLKDHPTVKFLRLQWLDYTATLRVRIFPVKRALEMFSQGKTVGITKAVLGLLEDDEATPGFGPTGEFSLFPQFESLRLGERSGYATVQGEFREKNGNPVVGNCPRTTLRQVIERGQQEGFTFLVGFEIEIVFMRWSVENGGLEFSNDPANQGHSWSSTRALQDPTIMTVLEEIVDALETCGIGLQQFHPESSTGQYEFITDPLPPLAAVDTLIATREIISSIATKHSFRATLFPKPSPVACGTGAHTHISMEPAEKHESFYAGVLKHLRSIAAFTYSNPYSYDRLGDGLWAGGRYVAWGSQNRETPLRRIEGSHWELKCVDGMANMYLALASILSAGLSGVVDDDKLVHADCTADPATLSPQQRSELGITEMLPASLEEALESLENDAPFRGLLGDEVTDTYVAVKRAELKKLMAMAEPVRRNWLIERF